MYIDDVDLLNGAPASNPNTVLHGRFGHTTQTASPASNDPAYCNNAELLQRIGQLEDALKHQTPSAAHAQNTYRLPPTPASTVARQEPYRSNGDATFLHGQSFQTRFNGSTHEGLSVNHIPGFSDFMAELFERFPTISRVRLQTRASDNATNLTVLNISPPLPAQLSDLLPNRTEADQLVQLFMDSYGCVYHILHLPSFQKDYENFWQGKDVNPKYIIVLILIIAVSLCLSSKATGDSSRQQATTMIRSCEQWLVTNFLKYNTIYDVQISFLLVFARQINAKRFKKTWANAGKTVRDFMCAGLHQEPGILKDGVSALDKEMRRRIWFAAAEFELQASLEQGMPAIPWQDQSDILPPSNIHDDEMEQDQVPESRPAREFTPTSYLAVASSSIFLRHTLNNILNNVRHDLSFEETKDFTDKIDALLAEVPTWADPRSELPRVLLSINLQQYKLVLHDRQVRRTASAAERSFSKMIILDTATKMIHSHRAILDSGSTALEMLNGDLVRTTLLICQVYLTLDPRSENLLSRVAEAEGVAAIKSAVTMLKEKVVRYGGDQRHMLSAVAASKFLRLKNEPDTREAVMRDALSECVSIVNGFAGGLQDRAKPYLDLQRTVDDTSKNGDISEQQQQDQEQQKQQDERALAEASDEMILGPLNVESWCLGEWDFDDYCMDYQDFTAIPL